MSGRACDPAGAREGSHGSRRAVQDRARAGLRHETRSAFRRAGLLAAAVVVVILAAGAALHLYGRARFASATAELEDALGEELVFDFGHLETAGPPDEENAAERLVAAMGALDLSDSEARAVSEARALHPREWHPELEQAVRALLSRHRSVLEISRELAGMERSSFGIRYRDGHGAAMPEEAVPGPGLARLLHVEGLLALLDGDGDRLLVTARALARFAASLQREHFFLFVAFAASVERTLNRLSFAVLEENRPWAENRAFLEELEAALPAWDWQERAREFLVVEAAMASVQARRAPAVPGPARFLFGHLVAAEILVEASESVRLLPLAYGRAQDRFDAAQFSPLSLQTVYDSWMFELDFFDRPGSLATFVKMLEVLPQSSAHGSSADAPARLIGFYLKLQVVAAERQLLRAASTLRREGLREGTYPPERPLPAVLAEPDPFVGDPISYRLADDGSAVLQLEGAEELLAERWGGRSWRQDPEKREWVKRWLQGKVFTVALPPLPPTGEAVSGARGPSSREPS